MQFTAALLDSAAEGGGAVPRFFVKVHWFPLFLSLGDKCLDFLLGGLKNLSLAEVLWIGCIFGVETWTGSYKDV